MTFKLGRIYVIIGFAVHFVTAQDPCDTAINIGDDQRSVDNELTVFAAALCDVSRITAGSWYRFDDTHTGGQMAEGCVDFLHCGTIYPAFLNTAGSHPTTVNQVVTAQVCVNDGTTCCSETHNIDIKMCNDGTDYYVYQLAILNGCDAAYCAGTGQACPVGQVYVQAVSACVDSYPAMTGDPVLSGPFTPVSEWDPFWFTCTPTYTPMQAGDDGARFRFKWYFDGVIDNTIDEITADSINLEGMLYETDLIGTAGKYISCGVEAYWDGSATESPLRFSNSYWIGITVPATAITLAQEEQTVEITISSTVPITGANCGFKDHVRRDDLCVSYSFDFETDPYGNDPTHGAIACEVTFSRGDMNGIVNAISKPPVGLMVPQNMVIQFEEYNMRDSAVWTDYTPPEIPIQVQNFVGMGLCYSVTDPHIKTFDTTGYYHLFEPGKFLAVKSSARLFEVHYLTRTCSRNRNVACNCGVAVREDNVVILVDNCDNGKFRTVKKVLSENNPNVGLLTPDKTGTKMTILMPSGAKITAVKNRDWHMNVYIELPSEDKGHVEGLCGSWDDNPSNDPSVGSRPTTFTEGYRIPHGQSLFDGFPECENLETTSVNFCTCDEGTLQPVCQAQASNFFDRQINDVCNGNNGRKKRQLNEFLSIFADLPTDPDFEPIGELTWPTASGITESEAEAACNAVIEQSAVFSVCADMQDFNITVEVAICIADVQIADNTSVAESLLDVFETNCFDTARLNVIIGADNETEANEVMTAIQSNICPNQCSGHGTCFNSTCTCETEYFGADCSVQYGVAPTVTELYNHGLCDLSIETCDQIKVTAQPVIEGLICRWKIINDLDVETGEVMDTTSALISSTTVFCSVPELSSPKLSKFLLSIAVDGETFSVDSKIAVYDSGCITCDDEATCTLLDGMCIMDDTCYEESVCGACESAIDIGHPHRSHLYNTSADDDVMCDVSRITPGYWYWFDAYTGNQMAETCPDLLQCGTLYPVWLSGDHPTVNNPVAEGLLCGNTGLEFGDNSSCCDWNTTVNIRYCTDESNAVYYVYQLPVLPFCNMAFCAGDREPCADGYAGNYENSLCEDIDECASNPCVYGTCSNELNQFTCTCQEGYNGINCENDAIDDCASSPCIHGSCNDLVNEYTCTCDYGYTGSNCEVDIDDCEGVDCNDGMCEDGTPGYTCTCEPGYTGYHCEEDIDECLSNPCVHGDCENHLNYYTCMCDRGYEGGTCNEDINACENLPCEHGTCESENADTPNGADFNIPFDDIIESELNEDILKRAIANSVNEFCVINLDICCSDMGMTYRAVGTLLSWLLTDPSLIEVHHGGSSADNTYFKLTIFVNVSTEAALDVCVPRNSYQGFIPLGDGVITSSVETAQAQIEEDTGILMSAASSQTGETTTEGSPGGSNALIIGVAGGAAGFFALIIVIVIIVILAMKSNKPKRSQSRVSVHSARHPTDIRPQSAKSVMYDNPSVVVDNDYEKLSPPSHPPLYTAYDFTKGRPRTGVRRNNQAPPLYPDGNDYDYISNMNVKNGPPFIDN